MPRNGEGRGVNKSENLSETPGGQGKGMADMEIKRAYRDRRPFTVVYIDLDNFR